MDYKIKLKNIKESCEILRLNDDAQCFVASVIMQNFTENDMVFVARNDAEMENIQEQLLFFAPQLEEKFEILNFHAWDCLPYDSSSPKQIISANRIKTLYKLSNRNNKNFILITNAHAILQKNISPNLVKKSSLIVKAKDKIEIKQIVDFLIFNGYQRQAIANDAGDFALRGGIIDIIMNKAATLVGYRLDFFGDEIDAIKEFDPITQISSEKVKEIEILPASEVLLNSETINNFRDNYRKNFSHNFSLNNEDQLYEAISASRHFQGMEHWLPFFYKEELTDIFHYLKKPVIFFSEQIFSILKNRHENILQYQKSRLENVKESKISGNIYNPIAPNLLYLDDEKITKIIDENINIIFRNFDSPNSHKRLIDLDIKPIPDFCLAAKTNNKNALELLNEYLGFVDKKTKIFIAALNENSKERLEKLFVDFEIDNVKILATNKAIVLAPLNHGFQASDLVIIGEQNIFGEKIIRKKNANKSASRRIIEESFSINLGELIVHQNHGIGKFDGIHKIEAGNIKTEMLRIIYGGSDILFVPVEDINLITRYGADNPFIQLDRLGVATWKNRKEKVKNKIKIAAEELIKIAAQRQVKKAPIFLPDQHLYEEFKERFGFVETEDQQRAIDEIEDDLAKGMPMDRLVCGDVGFGKTEVAMRAAFIVASSHNKSQVAIITPTTLLCRQHFANFKKRFEGTNIKIAQLSRLTTQTQNKETKNKIENGEIDIVIATHSILSKTMKFKNLAMVIVDEEQHFGVAQKERLKEMKNEAHILALSATPIPRTLQMSLTGVKDLSLIATPPLDRISVRNFVMTYDSVITKEAILREYQRSGKVFFVVPRIQFIKEMEDKLRKILPAEIKITHAHGQMTPNELDKIMNDFYDGKIDVLLSTTIIESGIDVATANTMIIYKAEMFGLAQLYQLRGRVGRGKIRGYAYFMMSDKKINNDARRKLEVMQNLDDLGVGFTIASHDMDIRGSGDILGDEQSGHIKETGVELYQQMMLEEIEKLKNKASNDKKETFEITNNIPAQNVQIKLGISLLIEEEYIEDLSLRISFYKKIASIRDENEQIVLENEMLNRFGKIPAETKNLMRISILRQKCAKFNIIKLENKDGGILVKFDDSAMKNADKLLKMIFESKGLVKLQPDQRVLFLGDASKNIDRIDAAFRVVEKIATI